jgi:alpha-beta hydrolase superfamily lysophospholipase
LTVAAPWPARLGSAAARWLWRWLFWLAAAAAALCAALALGFALYAVLALPPLQAWHQVRLDEEFSAPRDADLDFDGYLAREALLFAELSRTVAGWDRADEAFAQSRFNPDGMPASLADGAPFNRSMRLPVAQPRGQALLIHGLSDAPYSMRALAESLRAQGIAVTLLRLPGHGTLPSMMTVMRLRDWTAALRIAARDVAGRTPTGQPFYIGGYSTGGTLALHYALDALTDPALRRPDRVLLLSPAIELRPVAALANVIDMLAVLPIPLLDKVHWQEIAPEYDPYKFNSFPVNASRQVNHATQALKTALAEASAAGRIQRLPPVLTWQSVVDSTVGAAGVADQLYARLTGPGHRLVLFDLNRQQAWRSLVRPGAGALIERLQRGPRAYTLELVQNADPASARVLRQQLAPDGQRTTRDTGLDWPAGIISLGHVAMPFLPDDPVYGFLPGSGHAGLPSIGSLLLRGESGAITVSLGALTRLRSNPFWPLIDADVAALVAADLASPRP